MTTQTIKGKQVLLDNNEAIQAKDSSGTARNIAYIDTSNNLHIGDSGLAAIQFNSTPKTDTISEKTAGSGVTIDNCLIKDGGVEAVTVDRRGGDPNKWWVGGTTNYLNEVALIQVGAGITDSSTGDLVVTFPTAYPTGTKPVVFIIINDSAGGTGYTYVIKDITNTGFTAGTGGTNKWCSWLAIGPKP